MHRVLFAAGADHRSTISPAPAGLTVYRAAAPVTRETVFWAPSDADQGDPQDPSGHLGCGNREKRRNSPQALSTFAFTGDESR